MKYLALKALPEGLNSLNLCQDISMARVILIYIESNPGNNYNKHQHRDTHICTYTTYCVVGNLLSTSTDNTSHMAVPQESPAGR